MIRLILAILLATVSSSSWAGDFDRKLFGNFRDGVREEVASRQSEVRIRCMYTNEVVPIEATSLDHVVSVKEAWEYGASVWTVDQVRDFYNDTDNLVLVLSGINSQKGSRKNWSPPENKEWYYGKRKSICAKYRLSCPDGDN